MIVFRITLAIYADQLVASGNPARWNSKDIKIIYSAQSRSLACLENVVHRNSRGLQGNFKMIVIEIPDNLNVPVLDNNELIPGWQAFANLPYTQKLGDAWVAGNSSAMLRVPSVIVPGESNFLLNPAHDDFKKIRFIRNEPFEFDRRLKS